MDSAGGIYMFIYLYVLYETKWYKKRRLWIGESKDMREGKEKATGENGVII